MILMVSFFPSVGLAIIGILAIVMPQIEKRFNYSSLEVGMIAAANDVAAVVFGLIISHYGNFGNKVKWIGLGGVVTCEYDVKKILRVKVAEYTYIIKKINYLFKNISISSDLLQYYA